MGLKIAIQMDPPETINIDTDSTFVLALEAQKRGYELFYYHVKDLSFDSGAVKALAAPLTFRREREHHYILGERRMLDLAQDVDVVLMRQDPPFNMAYITATHILEHAADKTLIVNDPVSVRNAPEKLLVTYYQDLTPPTLITSSRAKIEEFRARHGDIILKPLYGNGGLQVFHLGPENPNLGSLLEMFGALYKEPIIVQKYLPEAKTGDKRIILCDGEPIGAILRRPPERETRANLHTGGTALKTELTQRELEICARIGPELSRLGLLFVGIDVIGDYLTEINVTSPTCLQEINRLNEDCLEAKIWDAIEKKLGKRHAA